MSALWALAGLIAGQEPTRPELLSIDPPAVTRGRTAELTLTGKKVANTSVVLSGEAASIAPAAPAAANSVTAKAAIPAGGVPEFAKVRLVGADGVSELRTLWIDPLPVAAAIAAGKPEDARPLDRPTVVHGRIAAEASQWFRVRTTAGERLTIDVLARRLGSPLDPAVRALDAATGRELLFADDTPGLHGDCRLSLRADADRELLVELRDARHRGGDDFFYVVRCGELPAPVAMIPAAVRRGTTAEVRLTDATGEEQMIAVSVPESAGPTVSVTPMSLAGAPGVPLELWVSDHDESAEREPNDTPEQANDLPVPGGVTGRFAAKNDRDVYRLRLTKGQKIRARADTAAIGSPADLHLTLGDTGGRVLAKSDPKQVVESLEFTAPSDGDYYLSAEHLNYAFGPAEVYRLVVEPVGPSFSLSWVESAGAVAFGQAALVAVEVKRSGYDGPIELEVGGAATGGRTIPAGTTGRVMVPVRATAEVGLQPIWLTGTARIADRDVRVGATGRDAVVKAMAGLRHPPVNWVAAHDLAVTPPPSVVIRSVTPIRTAAGTTVPVRVELAPVEDDSSVSLGWRHLPPGVTAAAVATAPGQSAALLEWRTAADAPVGDVGPVLLTATAHGRIATAVVPVTLSPPETPKEDVK